MSIRIVTHCYARELPQYARFLQCQLSSFVLYPPNVPIKIHVFLTPEDARTHRVIDWFCDYTPLSLSLTYLPAGQLWRRSIGRNIAAKQAEEELVWFTDVDHLFGDGCLDALWQTWAAMPQEQKRFNLIALFAFTAKYIEVMQSGMPIVIPMFLV